MARIKVDWRFGNLETTLTKAFCAHPFLGSMIGSTIATSDLDDDLGNNHNKFNY